MDFQKKKKSNFFFFLWIHKLREELLAVVKVTEKRYKKERSGQKT